MKDMVALLGLSFWILVIFKYVMYFKHLVSRREFLSLSVIIDSVGLLQNILWATVFGLDWINAFALLWVFWLRQDYKLWKKHKDDDDDDYKHTRRSWVRNKLPKPVTKPIPQPQ